MIPRRRVIHIVYPEDTWLTEEQIIMAARDDVANGKSSIADRIQDVQTLADAIDVLNDSGSITVDLRGSGL